MKTLDEYLQMPYRMEIVPDPDEGGIIASYPELPGCLSAGKTIEEAAKNALDAKTQWLKAAYEDGVAINVPDSEKEYSGQFKLRMPKTLHRLLAEKSKQEGISMNQYCLFLLSRTAI